MAREHIARCRAGEHHASHIVCCQTATEGYGHVVGLHTIGVRRGERQNPFCDLTISIALTRPFLAISNIMRLVVEIVIIGAVISLGWSKPFKEHFAQLNRIITSTLHDAGSNLQKHQDPSVKRH